MRPGSPGVGWNRASDWVVSAGWWKGRIAWLSKCRAILVRWDKKACNYLGLLKLACALLWYRRRCRLADQG